MRFGRIPKREKRQLNVMGDAGQTLSLLRLRGRTPGTIPIFEVLHSVTGNVQFYVRSDGYVVSGGTIAANGGVVGNVTGNVIGNLTGNLLSPTPLVEKQVGTSRTWGIPKKNREDQFSFAFGRLQAKSATKAQKVSPVFTGDVQAEATSWFYFGDPTVDGTWRIGRSGSDFVHDLREAGSWVTKHTITP